MTFQPKVWELHHSLIASPPSRSAGADFYICIYLYVCHLVMFLLVPAGPRATGKGKAGSDTSWKFEGQVIVARTARLQLLPLFRTCTVHKLLPSVVRGKDSLLRHLGRLYEQQTRQVTRKAGLGRCGYLSVFVGQDLEQLMPNRSRVIECIVITLSHLITRSRSHTMFNILLLCMFQLSVPRGTL